MKKLIGYKNSNAFNRRNLVKFPPSYPNEMMVKILSSNAYSKILTKSFFKKKLRVLEIGCFSGNNLRFFIEKNYNVAGVEINKEMINLGVKNLKRLKYKVPKIVLGHNTNLPFADNSFDLLVSINTLHYCSQDEVLKALIEFKRVLKKRQSGGRDSSAGGIAYIETSGSKHFSRKMSKKLAPLRWRWKSNDFKDGYEFGFFSNKKHFELYLKKIFSEVEVFERTEFAHVDLHFYQGLCAV